MSKHTPGPWEWETFKAPILPRLWSSDVIICDFGSDEPYYPVGGTPPNEANARLIAAAPELLEALKALINNVGSCICYDESERECKAWEMAEAAIAKAEGGVG